MFPDITSDDIFRLETTRLWLRWLRAADAPALTSFASLAPVAQMTATIPHPYPPGEAERFILAARATTASGKALILAITLKNKARTFIGVASAQSSEAYEIEIGYVIAPSVTGRGYASEALGTLLDAVFNLTEARMVHADSRTINLASRRVLEKNGFLFTKAELKDLPARGGRHPCDFFRLDRHEWSARHRVRRLPAMAQQKVPDMQQAIGEQPQ